MLTAISYDLTNRTVSRLSCVEVQVVRVILTAHEGIALSWWRTWNEIHRTQHKLASTLRVAACVTALVLRKEICTMEESKHTPLREVQILNRLWARGGGEGGGAEGGGGEGVGCKGGGGENGGGERGGVKGDGGGGEGEGGDGDGGSGEGGGGKGGGGDEGDGGGGDGEGSDGGGGEGKGGGGEGFGGRGKGEGGGGNGQASRE